MTPVDGAYEGLDAFRSIKTAAHRTSNGIDLSQSKSTCRLSISVDPHYNPPQAGK